MRLRRDDPPSLHGRGATEMVAGEPVRSGDGLSVDLETSGLNPPPSARSSHHIWRWPAGRGSSKNPQARTFRSEEHTSELQSLMRISYAVFCLKKKNNITYN